MGTVRATLHFLRRCWTGEDLTVATTIVGLGMLVALVWLIESLASSGLRAIGIGEPTATIGGWAVAGAYAVIGGTHDYRAVRRREEREQCRSHLRHAVVTDGIERVVRQYGQVADTDLDSLGAPRRLWRIEDDHGDDLLVAVEVVNSSPDPDGTRRAYVLRVPPGIRTCRAAVAWTFRLDAGAYQPLIET